MDLRLKRYLSGLSTLLLEAIPLLDKIRREFSP